MATFQLRNILIGLVCSAFLGAGCHRHEHGKNGDHGHAHGHGHGHDEGDVDTGEAVSVTLFTKKTELFMEYSPLVIGKKASFLAHITILGKSFLPVRSGSLFLDFMQGRRVVKTLIAEGLLREGIFKPEGIAPAAGSYSLRLRLNTGKVSDTISVAKAIVYPTVQAAKKANPKQPDDPNELSFLKEQQWKIPFATALAQRRRLRDGLSLSGESRALPGSHVRLMSPLSGRVSGMSQQVQEGRLVRKGQRLFFVEPMLLSGASLPQLNQDVRAAQASLRLSRLQLQRLKKMVRARALASWKISQVKHQINMYKAQLKSAKARRSLFYRSRSRGSGRAHALIVRAPLQGVILKQFASNGSFVSQGQPLVEIASLQKMRLIAYLPEAYVSQIKKIRSASYQIGTWRKVALSKPDHIGAAIDPVTRTLPLFFTVNNKGFLRHRQKLTFKIHVSTRKALAVPSQAIVDDQGTPVVFVQTGGESFEKRAVTTGIRDQHWVELHSGVRPGERIVRKGAYELLLSLSLKQSKAAGHGHAH